MADINDIDRGEADARRPLSRVFSEHAAATLEPDDKDNRLFPTSGCGASRCAAPLIAQPG